MTDLTTPLANSPRSDDAFPHRSTARYTDAQPTRHRSTDNILIDKSGSGLSIPELDQEPHYELDDELRYQPPRTAAAADNTPPQRRQAATPSNQGSAAAGPPSQGSNGSGGSGRRNNSNKDLHNPSRNSSGNATTTGAATSTGSRVGGGVGAGETAPTGNDRGGTASVTITPTSTSAVSRRAAPVQQLQQQLQQPRGGSPGSSPQLPQSPNVVPPYGNSRLCCKERCLVAADHCSSYAIMLIIVVFNGVFIYIFYDLPVWRWTTVIAATLSIITFTVMFMASTTNPGIVRKNTQGERMPPGTSRHMVVNGVTIRLPYCVTCNLIRPPRASHCHVCDNCVGKFDHHCGVIGACVGEGNFRYFFGFLASLALLCCWVGCWSLWYLAYFWNASNHLKKGLSGLLGLVCVIFFFHLSALTMHYVKLITNGYTHREYVKHDQLYGVTSRNPFDHGCGDNCGDVWCEPNYLSAHAADNRSDDSD